MEAPTPGEGEVWELNPQPVHAIAVGPMLPPGEYKREFGRLATAISPFAKLLWSFLFIVRRTHCMVALLTHVLLYCDLQPMHTVIVHYETKQL